MSASGASAAVWEWRCHGETGGQWVLFNRDAMAVVDAKQAKGGKLSDEKVSALIKDADINYAPQNTNDGLVGTIEFIHPSDAKRKIVLTEKSSRRISHKHKLICGRDEDTDIYRKVYRYQREDEPARDITMQCLEYQLSTRGGRKGCD